MSHLNNMFFLDQLSVHNGAIATLSSFGSFDLYFGNLAAETELPYLRISFSLMLILFIFGKLYVEPHLDEVIFHVFSAG
jgi:hypothetical protein